MINQLAATIAKVLPTAGPTFRCTEKGCPIPEGQTTTSVADTIGMYGFNIVAALSVPGKDEAVGQAVADLVNQQTVLDFISQTVAEKVAPLGSPIPTDVADTVGNAVATFVQNSLGNAAIAKQLAPFLYQIGVPTDYAQMFSLVNSLKQNGGSVIPYLFGKFSPNAQPDKFGVSKAQQALVKSFFTNADVQKGLGAAAADAVNVLLGQAAPSWVTPAVSSTAVGDYVGQIAATTILGAGNSYTQALATTIGNAVNGLFTSIKNPVDDAVSNAMVALLRWTPPLDVTDQQSTAVTLSDLLVNTVFGFLQPADNTDPLPFPDEQPQESLAPAAGVAVTAFVDTLFGPSNLFTVEAGLSKFTKQVIPGVLANVGVQDLIDQNVSDTVAGQFGDPALGAAVGALFGQAAVQLVQAPVVGTALVATVNAAAITFLNSAGVVSAVADTAGALTTATLLGDPTQKIIDDLRADTDVQNAAGAAATAGVATLLGTMALWDQVDTTAAWLVLNLLADPDMQTAVGGAVYAQVYKTFNGTAFGQAVGGLVEDSVVALMANTDVQDAFVGLVDNVATDFFGTPGVVDAFSDAAGTLAAAEVAGTLKEVAPVVQAALRNNMAVKGGVETAVGDAVTTFLNDGLLWAAVDGQLGILVDGLTTDAQVLTSLDDYVAEQVAGQFGDPALGAAVGALVGQAAVQIIGSAGFNTAATGFVDNLFAEFFSQDGVVEAFADAADGFALNVLTGESITDAAAQAQELVTSSTAVQNGVDVTVTDSVAAFLGTMALWDQVDTTAAWLVLNLLADPDMQT
ncbi:MAG: hypothetical protein ACR2JM_10400, partial [Mycobacterium sp.]